MSEFITANIVRNGTQTIASNIAVQMSKMDVQEASDYQGSNPHFVYQMYTRQIPIANPTLIQQGDHVIDASQGVVDPKTHTQRTYLIISDPNPKALMNSWSWVAERMRGT